MGEFGRDFKESIERLVINKNFSIRTLIIMIIIIISLEVLLTFAGNELTYGKFLFLIIVNAIFLSLFVLEKFTTQREARSQFEEILANINNITIRLTQLEMFHNKQEKIIFKQNLESFYIFKLTQNYKYCMIAMGSMIEFLLLRYCKDHSINPKPIITDNGKIHSGDNFANYIQTAIENDLFGQKKSWIIVQTSLRSFRNYVHIPKEVKEEEIDLSWYYTITPIFFRLLLEFDNGN